MQKAWLTGFLAELQCSVSNEKGMQLHRREGRPGTAYVVSLQLRWLQHAVSRKAAADLEAATVQARVGCSLHSRQPVARVDTQQCCNEPLHGLLQHHPGRVHVGYKAGQDVGLDFCICRVNKQDL